MVIIDDNALFDYMVLLREGWDSLTTPHPYLQVTDLLNTHKGSKKVYLYQDPHFLPHLYTKTTKNKFCIDIPLGNPSVEFK